MKLTILISITAAFQLSAVSFSQSCKLNMQIKNGTVAEVFHEIEKQSGYTIFYKDNLVNIDRKVDFTVSDESVEATLKSLFSDTKNGYTIIDKIIVITPENSKQTYTIKGKITDAQTGEVLIGVNVIVEGTTVGTVSDVNGYYSIDVPGSSATLSFSSIGYLTEKVAVSGRPTIDISLVQDVKNLDEVVIVGYGTQKKSDLTGAVSSISNSDLLKGTAASLDQAMQGRAAGVHITSSSGRPGAPINIQIRGVGTIGNTDPLYVIDGNPIYQSNNALNPGGIQVGNTMSTLNTNDIESIEILKDASATAIYGARAANGVVIITTKRGKAGKTKISFDSYAGIQKITKKLDVLNGKEYAQFVRKQYEATGDPAKYPMPSMSLNPDTITRNTNWQDLIFRTAPVQNYNLQISGGSENSQFSVSGGYFKQDGIVVNSGFERYSLQINSDFTRGKFKFGESLSLARTNDKPVNNGGGSIISTALAASPLMPIKDDSKLGGYGVPLDIYSMNNNNPNPLALLELNQALVERNRMLGNVYGEYKILKTLTYRLNIGIDYAAANGTRFMPAFEMGTSNVGSDKARLSEGRSWTNTMLVENLLSYNKIINNHNISGIFAYTSQAFKQNGLSANLMQFDVESVHAPDNAQEITGVQGNSAEWSIRSYVGRLNYAYNNKYLLGISFRRDGSSRFGSENRWATFPSVSVGWKLSSENFMASIPSISHLKLRASWGKTGNQEISNYGHLSLLNPNVDYIFGNTANGTVFSGTAPTIMGVSNLKWETITQSNIGLDLGLFDNSIFATAEYFDKKTTDMLIEYPVPAYTGYIINPFINGGELVNSGFEFSVTYRKTAKDFSYNIGANLTTLRNQITEIKGSDGILGFDGDQIITKTNVGHEIGTFFGYVSDGLFQTQEEVNQYNDLTEPGVFYQNASTQPGDVKYKDINGDGKINADDRTYLGSAIPKLIFGVTGDINYKGFDLSAFFQGISGSKVYNNSRRRLESLAGASSYGNRSSDILNAWNGPNTSNTIPRIHLLNNENNLFSDKWLEDGSYVRLKNLTIGYTLPENLLSKMGNISKCRVYLSSTNVFTLTKYQGFDPEIGNETPVQGNGQPSIKMGFDNGVYPQARTFTAGIQLMF